MDIDTFLLVWSAGAIVLMLLFGVVQMVFYRAHRERYGTWKSPHDEYVETGQVLQLPKEALKAHFSRADDPKVERLRLATLATFIAFIVWASGIPATFLAALISR